MAIGLTGCHGPNDPHGSVSTQENIKVEFYFGVFQICIGKYLIKLMATLPVLMQEMLPRFDYVSFASPRS